MALLTGFNRTFIEKFEDPYGKNIDSYPFIFKKMEKAGYATALAEDETPINTFNLNKKGFFNQPVTHYFRPFAIAIEQNLEKKRNCLGFQHYSDFVFKFGIDIAEAYKNDPFFALIWLNTFSHNNLNAPSAMDEKVLFYMKMLENREILNNSAVFFMSDHGMRIGKSRQTLVS
jgi:hypothetical protein